MSRTTVLRLTLWWCQLWWLSDAIPIDNGIEGEPEIICGPTSIKVVFQTRNAWEGKLYTKNFFNVEECRVLGSSSSGREASLELPFDAPCGVSRTRSVTPRGVFVDTTVIMSFHPIFITKVDRAVRLQCFYMEADKTVSQEIEVSPLTSELASQQVPMPVCRYDILDAPDGQPIRFALVGQAVWHKWTCDSETLDTFCMSVYSCFVDDGTNGDTIELINLQGCANDKFLLGNIEYPSDLMGIKEAHVFKYADRPNLYFNCQIKITIKDPGSECPRVQCPDPTRQRRQPNVPNVPDVPNQPYQPPVANPWLQQHRFSRNEYRRRRVQRDTLEQTPGALGVMDVEPEHPVMIADIDFESGLQLLRGRQTLQQQQNSKKQHRRSHGWCMSRTAVLAYASAGALLFISGIALCAALYFTSARKRD